ncbi:Laminin subunit gamma-1, partial [Bienertia sinuspersici]
DVFCNENMESYREHVLNHMKEFCIHRKPPNGLDEKEWKWLIKEVYSSEDIKGGNKGMKPKLVDIFHSTRKKGTSIANVETAKKLDEIRDTMEKDPSLSDVLIAQKVFNSKSRDRVVGFGGGMKVADLRGQRPSREELEAELNSTKKQNQILEDRMEAIQDENNQLKGRIGSVESQMKMF